MPRRGTSNSSPGRNCSFTDRGSETGSTQRKYTLSQLTPQRAGLLSSPPSPPPRSGGPACTGPPQWTALIPPLTNQFPDGSCTRYEPPPFHGAQTCPELGTPAIPGRPLQFAVVPDAAFRW